MAEDEGDERFWLPPDVPIINEYRAAKFDIVTETRPSARGEEIRFAQVQVNSLLNFLHAGKVLDSQHVHDGQTYEIWQTCFTWRQQIHENRIYSPEMREMQKAVEEDGLDPSDFVKVLRGLSHAEKKLIDLSIQPGTTDHKRWVAVRSEKHYRAAYDRLTRIMQALRDAHEERKKNSCDYPQIG
jgi:hypothetical protein